MLEGFHNNDNDEEKNNPDKPSEQDNHSDEPKDQTSEIPIQEVHEENPDQEESKGSNDYSSYGGNVQYKWNYDDYQKALVKKNKPAKKRKKGVVAFIVSICSVFAIAIIGLAGVGVTYMVKNGVFSGMTKGSSSGTASASSGPSLNVQNKPTESSSATASGTAMSVEQVVKAVGNSVVGIVTYDLKSVDASAEGSGVIMNSDGYIITNEHVIDGAQKIEVVLSDNKQYDATLVGKDSRTDLAVIKINKTGLTAATFGNSDQINVGESVIAIGNPGGLEFAGTVTEGIISALNRTVSSESGYTMSGLIQTDAPINPGNSGGALVNKYGQVIGITSSKISATGYEGMGFAIPVNTATPIINSLIKYGYVKDRVKIGISVSEFSDYQAKIYNMPSGLIIQSIDSSSDAAGKGLKVNDIITKINGTSVTSYNQFYTEESKSKPGDTITLTIYRYNNGSPSTFDVKVKLAEDKGDTTTSSSSSSQSQSQGNSSNWYKYYQQNQSYSSSQSGSDQAAA